MRRGAEWLEALVRQGIFTEHPVITFLNLKL